MRPATAKRLDDLAGQAAWEISVSVERMLAELPKGVTPRSALGKLAEHLVVITRDTQLRDVLNEARAKMIELDELKQFLKDAGAPGFEK
jgi:hypothetical protein